MSSPAFSDRAWMTPLLNRIADAAGERAAIELAREKAGEQIYIPNAVDPDHWLARLIGIEQARKLVKTMGGEKIVIPAALNGDKRRRARTIAELIEKGYSNNEIVRLTGVSRSTIIAHRHKVIDDRQGNLF